MRNILTSIKNETNEDTKNAVDFDKCDIKKTFFSEMIGNSLVMLAMVVYIQLLQIEIY